MKHFESLRRVSESAAVTPNRMFFLDLSNPEHFDCVVEQFGGQQHVMQEYPHFWELLERTRNRHASNGVSAAPYKVEDLEEYVYVSDMHVSKDGVLMGTGRVTLPQNAVQMALTATLYQGDECVGHSVKYDAAVSRMKVDCKGDRKWQNGEAKLVIHFTMQRANEDILTAGVVVCTDHELMADPIQKVEIIHPSTKYYWYTPKPVKGEKLKTVGVTPQEQYVNVCYARMPDSGEQCNYYYAHGLVNGQQEIYLDLQGNVFFKTKEGSPLEFDGVVSVRRSIDTSNGAAQGATPADWSKYIYAIDGGFHFEFPTDWGAKIPGGILAAREMCMLNCEIKYRIKGESDIKLFVMDSHAPFEEAHWTKVPLIKLNWGCVGRDTNVLMADYTLRPIDQIKVGDQILGGTTKMPVRVTSVITGQEADLWCVQSAAGEKIHVTDDHPFVTKEGNKRAIELMEKDSVLMQDGSYSDMEYRYEEYYGDTVFNLELETDHFFVANGYVIGDQQIQGEVMRNTMNSSCIVPPEVQQEIEKMRAQLGKACD